MTAVTWIESMILVIGLNLLNYQKRIRQWQRVSTIAALSEVYVNDLKRRGKQNWYRYSSGNISSW